MRNSRLAILVLCLLAPPLACGAAAGDQSASALDASFASQIGLAAPAAPAPPAFTLSLGAFRGTYGPVCSSMDLNTFLRQFDPQELLAQVQQSLLAGAQASISNYLVTLAYSAPTLASVLDMTDRQLAARFAAFSQTCASQQMRSAVQQSEASIGRAADQCFAVQIGRGTAPTEAFRRCSIARDFDALGIPAAMTTLDFLRLHTDLTLTPRLEALIELLPDQRIAAGSLQTRPPRASLAAYSDSIKARARLALDQMIDAGQPNADVCGADAVLHAPAAACLPESASAVVSSPAFRSARLLGPVARVMFKEALSDQIAVTAVYSDLLDLSRQIAASNLRSDSGAGAGEMMMRQRAIQDQIAHLRAQADLQVKLQDSKLRLARTQLLALQKVQADLKNAADGLQQAPPAGRFSINSLLRLFQSAP